VALALLAGDEASLVRDFLPPLLEEDPFSLHPEPEYSIPFSKDAFSVSGSCFCF